MWKHQQMTTVTIDYPTNFTFRTRKIFLDDKERTKYLHRVLRVKKVPSPLHEYTDYVVEDVQSWGNYEFWVIGS